jgi:hypothetical protein
MKGISSLAQPRMRTKKEVFGNCAHSERAKRSTKDKLRTLESGQKGDDDVEGGDRGS